MAQVSVSLPVDLNTYVDGRVAAEGYADAAEFVRSLIKRDQDAYQAEVHRVRALVQDGIDSGTLDDKPEDVLNEIIEGIATHRG